MEVRFTPGSDSSTLLFRGGVLHGLCLGPALATLAALAVLAVLVIGAAVLTAGAALAAADTVCAPPLGLRGGRLAWGMV